MAEGIPVANCSSNLNVQYVSAPSSAIPSSLPSSTNSPPSKMNLDPVFPIPNDISLKLENIQQQKDPHIPAATSSDSETVLIVHSSPTYITWNSPDGAQHITIGLTYGPIDIVSETKKIKSPRAGAVLLFLGTTRDNFENKPVSHLSYSTYPALALNTLLGIAKSQVEKHELVAACIVHRLGVVPIGEESVIVGVSSPHRRAAFRAGEEMLERVKERAEIWKKEAFRSGEEVWRDNKDSMG